MESWVASDPLDRSHMTAALALARRALGRAAPNPAVGCIIAQGPRVVGRGWTQPGGRPHAETEALARAGPLAKGATAYVTLEPCAHHGRTPPCCEALIEAGVSRCLVALEDPDRRVDGKGLAAMRDAGVRVETGLCRKDAEELNAGFLSRVKKGRPLVTLKLATTLDGHIATGAGESRWITGPAARRMVHLLRAEHDAVMVGSGTALADDPRLDVRLAGLEERSPARIVMDGRLRLPLDSVLVTSAAENITLLLTREKNSEKAVTPYREAGVDVYPLPAGPDGSLSAESALALLGEEGITRLLVEGGGELAASLLRSGLVDNLVWFRAPKVLGADARPAIADLGIGALKDCTVWRMTGTRRIGEDTMECYSRVSRE